MKKVRTGYFLVFLFIFRFFSQNCDQFLTTDSINIKEHSSSKTFSYKTPSEDDQLKVVLTSANNKYYLKIFTSKILYFDMISNLEIVSENMSIIFKDTRLIKAGEQKGLFIIEIQKNYVTTLKNYGITQIIFNNTKENVPKKITKLIRLISECFLSQISNNEKK